MGDHWNDIKEIAKDLSKYNNTTYEEELYKIGFYPDGRLVGLGDIKALKSLGVKHCNL